MSATISAALMAVTPIFSVHIKGSYAEIRFIIARIAIALNNF